MPKKLKDAFFVEDWKETDGTILSNIVYDSTKNLKYDLFLPTSSAPKDKPVGAMLFIHGGAWKEGSKEDFHFACKRYAKLGYVTASLEYTLWKEGEKTTFFTMLDDIGKCLAHLRDTSAKHHYPVKAVALSGMSAGAHLAMLYAYSRAKESPIPIVFVFQHVGPSYFGQDAMPINPAWTYQLVSAGSGSQKSREEFDSGKMEAEIKSISPALLVTEETVPSILAYGGRDFLVAPIHAEKLREALEKHHVPHVLVLFPKSGHFLIEDPESSKKFHEAILDYCQKYFGK